MNKREIVVRSNADTYVCKKKWEEGRKETQKERHIPMNSIWRGALSSLSESEILFFRTGSSSGSSRMFLDSSEDKFASRPRVAELGIEDGVTTKEEPSFTA